MSENISFNTFAFSVTLSSGPGKGVFGLIFCRFE